ncbi:MAG: DUF1684 domain-containing protein [Marmoricola sp.]
MSDFEAAWRSWRDAREERLRSARGWLAITAIHWLNDVPQRFDDVPGEWSGGGSAATVRLGDDEVLAVGDEHLTTGVHLFTELDEDGLEVAFGDAVAEVADRDGTPIVRPRHAGSPNLAGYRGTPCYPPDPRWILPARYEPYAAPDGDAVGEVVLSYEGAEHRLVAWVGDDDGSLWILFRDATSGITTYGACRQLLTEPPAADGTLTLDLNRAYNLPCAYTDFATCPVAPVSNTFPFAVEAGEQLPSFSRPGA